MRPGRELDTFIAEKVLGHQVKIRAREVWETTSSGERHLRKFSRDIAAAWEVVEKLGITIIPVEEGQWFAFVGPGKPWNNPAEFVEFLSKADFVNSGAAVGSNPAEVICLAAYKAIKKREHQSVFTSAQSERLDTTTSPIC